MGIGSTAVDTKTDSHDSTRRSRDSNTFCYKPGTTLRTPSSTTIGLATTPKKGTGDALHLETNVKTAGYQYKLLIAIVRTVHCARPNNG